MKGIEFLEKNIPLPKFLKNKIAWLLFLNILIGGVVIFFLWQNYNTRKLELLSSKQENLLFNYTAFWNSYRLVSESFYKDINISILTDVITGKKGVPVSSQKTENPKNIQFGLPENSALLKENKFSQDIEKILQNKSIKDVPFSQISTKGQYSGGFKISETFTGFQYIFPLYFEDLYIGKAETSFTFAQLRDEMKKIFPAYYNFIVHRKIVEEKIPSNQKREYSSDGLTGFYTLYQPKGQEEESKDSAVVNLSSDIVLKINKKIEKETLKNLGEGNPFWLWTNIEGKDYTIIFLPISNIEKQHVGYIVAYYRDFSLQNIQKDLQSKIFITLVLFFFASFFILFIYKNNKKISYAYQKIDETNHILTEQKKILEERSTILEKMNKHMVHRELKMVELKKEIENCKKKKK